MKDFFKREESRNAFRARKQNERKIKVQEITSSRAVEMAIREKYHDDGKKK